jgi:MFS transporter, DHA2 family, multidrug resistance protein
MKPSTTPEGVTPPEALPVAPVPEISSLFRAMILVTVSICTMLYALTATVVNVALPQLQGALSATPDQIAWVVTLNVVATAVVTPMTGWLVGRLGERPLLLWAIAGFAVSTLLCATAASLETLLIYRVFQGAFGAPIVPLSQSILLLNFTGKARPMAQGFFGMAVVVGPAVGPALGGYFAEAHDWRWIFYLIVPMCIIAFLLVISFIRPVARELSARLDWTGFLALSFGIICLQLFVDRGERLDWFSSQEIILYACGAGLGLYLFIVHTATSDTPFLNPQLFKDRNFVLGLVLVFVYGTLNFTPITLLPPMLHNLKGYPDSLIGMLLAMRGLGMVIGFFTAGRLGWLDPRVTFFLGMVLNGISGLLMASFSVDVSPEAIGWAAVLQGIGSGLMWVPLVVMSFVTLEEKFLPEGSSIFHLLRNFGTSVFISLSFMVVVRTGRTNYSELAENINPYNEALRLPSVTGQWDLETIQGLSRIAIEMKRQASMIGYDNAFVMYSIVCFASLPLLLLVRVKRT